MLDWLAPTEAPFRRGAFLGFDGRQGPGHIYHAVLEGIALTMADNIDSMEHALGRGPGELVVTGGGSKSDLMMQMLADVLDRRSRRSGMEDAAGLGAAICACVGLGVHPDFDTARRAMVRSGKFFVPDSRRASTYRPIREKYRRIRDFTDPLFSALAL